MFLNPIKQFCFVVPDGHVNTPDLIIQKIGLFFLQVSDLYSQVSGFGGLLSAVMDGL